MDEQAYDRQRAEWLRRRYRLIMAVLLALVVGLSLLTWPQFGTPGRAVSIMLPVALSMAAQLAWLSRPRSWRVLEAYVVGGGFSIIIASCVTLYFVRLEDLPRYALTMLLSMLTIPALCRLAARWTLAHILTYVTGITIVVLLRGPVPLLGPLALTQVVIAAIALALDAGSRDRFARAEFAALGDARAAHARIAQEESARTRLFVNLSHDFRTPLAVISAHAQHLATQNAHPVEAARRIDSQARSLADLVAQLLELARLEAGRTPVNASAIGLLRLARAVATDLAPVGSAITVHAESGLGAWADERQVRRILQNLVANAVRQLQQGATRVTVEITRENTRARIDVSDDGPGVPAERRATIFERFASFDSDGSTAAGIGLPLARELARLNGGDVTLLEGPGAIFRLTLPAAETADEPAADIPAANAPQPVEPPVEPRGEVLIVEDNPAMAEIIEQALAARVTVQRAASLGEAKAALARYVPRAIVSDVLLGDGTSYELLERMRAEPRLREIPILFLSALGEEDQRVRGLVAGADDYLAKPFSVEELRARVATALERVERRRAAVRRMCDELVMELHDGVTGALSRAAVLLAASQAERPDRRIDRAGRAVAEALDEARTLMAVVEGASETFDLFVDDLRGEAAVLCERHDLALHFDSSGDRATSLLPTTAQALRRIMIELVTNTIKHAGARQLTLAVHEGGGQIQLQIADDGVGLAPDHIDGRGLGQIRRRLDRLGGELLVHPSQRGVSYGLRLPNQVRATP
jgi:signal transduction histidine kinase